MAREQRLRSRAGQLGLHSQHLPGGSGEGLGHLVHCDPVAGEVVWRAAAQVLVVASAAGWVLRLRSKAHRPCTALPPESPTPYDPCVVDNDSCRGTQDTPLRLGKGERPRWMGPEEVTPSHLANPTPLGPQALHEDPALAPARLPPEQVGD